MSGYLGFPSVSQPYNLGPGVSSFDVRSISDSINRAAESLSDKERGALTVQLNEKGAGAGLVVRIGPGKILGTITKPVAGKFGWSLSGRVSFLAGGPPESVRLLPGFRGAYRFFRERGAWWLVSVFKAFALVSGREVRLG